MKLSKIEAVTDALSFVHKAHDPNSLAYQYRNPIMLKSYAKVGKHQVDENGIRIFESYLGGYKAAIFDVDLKVNCKSNAGLEPTDTLKNLLSVYGVNQEKERIIVVSFLRKALDKTIDLSTPLTYFKD